MDNTKELTTISLCTGYGGLELGIRLTGTKVRTITYVEIEAFAIANLVKKIEAGKMDAAPIWSNLKTFQARTFCGKVDLLTGGYPCQPFSVAGTRLGEEDERHLFPYIKRIIEECRPRMLFFENVEGHLSCGFESVRNELQGLGYKITAGLFTASEIGASHQRKRLFIFGELEKEELEHPNREGLPGRWGHVISAKKKFEYYRGGSAFPSFPGSEARDWENTRYKPRVDRTNDGTADKVDRLRLLGNGVIPLQSAKAWLYLTGGIF